jgi:hypothetical protein
MILFYLLGSYTGRVSWIITTNSEKAKVQVEVVDANGVVVAIGDGVNGQVEVHGKFTSCYSIRIFFIL